MAIMSGMAKMTIRSTFALDRETVENLERLAKKWGVSKSEALRRMIADRDEHADAYRLALRLRRDGSRHCEARYEELRRHFTEIAPVAAERLREWAGLKSSPDS